MGDGTGVEPLLQAATASAQKSIDNNVLITLIILLPRLSLFAFSYLNTEPGSVAIKNNKHFRDELVFRTTGIINQYESGGRRFCVVPQKS